MNLTDDIAEKIYKHFRCGLVHEGRVKEGGRFCLGKERSPVSSEVSDEDYHLIIHPKKVLRNSRQRTE